MFYSVYLVKDGSRLVWKMNRALRGVFIFLLISVIAMFVFSFDLSEYRFLSPAGKINTILLPFFLLAGVLYEDSVIFDKENRQIILKRGLVFFYRKKIWDADDFKGTVYRKIKTGRIYGSTRSRVLVGFQMTDKFVLMDRNCPENKADIWIKALQTFWPRPFTISE